MTEQERLVFVVHMNEWFIDKIQRHLPEAEHERVQCFAELAERYSRRDELRRQQSPA